MRWPQNLKKSHTCCDKPAVFTQWCQSTEGPAPYAHFGIVLHEIRKNPPLAHTKAKNCGSGNRVSDFCVSGGPHVSGRFS